MVAGGMQTAVARSEKLLRPFSSFSSSLRNRQSVPWAWDLLRARLDHPCFVETQCIKADRFLGVVLAPRGVREPLHRCLGGLVALHVASVPRATGSPGRVRERRGWPPSRTRAAP